MQGRFTLHGIDERHVIHTGGKLGEQVAHPNAGLPMPSEFPKARLAVSGFGSKELEFTIRVKGGAGTPFKFRFVIESVDMAETA